MALVAEITHLGLVGMPRAGATIYANLTIRNIYSVTAGIMAGGALEYGVSPWPSLSFSPGSVNLTPGGTYTFSTSFTVPYLPPGAVIKVYGYSYWYGDAGEGYNSWHWDDEVVKSFTIEAAPEPEPTFSDFGVKAFSKV